MINSTRGVKTVEGNDESLYCHGNLIIPLIKRGMMSDYAHVNPAGSRSSARSARLIQFFIALYYLKIPALPHF